MSSYLGGFPPRIPRRLIEEWIPPRTTILDPFCGSGTTLIEAKLSGRPSIGVDLNPLAVALAQAKVQPISLDDVLYRLTDLAEGFRGETDLDESPESLAPIFHRRTLAQLCYLRKSLDDRLAEDIFLRGCVLGIMHGKGRRDGTTTYLSVDMPNTFSMSPEYVRRFVERNRLHPPPVDVFLKVRQRCDWLLRMGALHKSPPSTVLQGDAAQIDGLLRKSGVHTVGAIITSPPYLGILRYGAFNWIRLWFLGYNHHQIDQALAVTDSLDIYLSFMASFLAAAGRVLRPEGVMVLVIGDVVENSQYVRLAERIWTELEGLVPFELIKIETDAYDQTTKTTRVWGEQRKGQATPMDRVIVLRRTVAQQRNVSHFTDTGQPPRAVDRTMRRRS
jgi:SAM-dependent methyltransferase